MTDHEHLSLYNQYVNNSAPWDEVTNCVVAEYVWIDGSGIVMRSKCRTLTGQVNSLEDLPEWNYDGSSCY